MAATRSRHARGRSRRVRHRPRRPVSLQFARVSFRDGATVDLRALAERSHATLVEFWLLEALDARRLTPTPPHDFSKTDDLADCGKIVVTVEGEPEHRIVVRDVGDGGFEISEVIAIEDRTGDLPTCWPVCAWNASTTPSAGPIPNDASPASGGFATSDQPRS